MDGGPAWKYHRFRRAQSIVRAVEQGCGVVMRRSACREERITATARGDERIN
jgi:hypothetical protein